MRHYLLFVIIMLSLNSCKEARKESTFKANTNKAPFTAVEVAFMHQDSTSIRAIEVTDNAVMYAGSDGHYGIYKKNNDQSKSTDAVIAASFKEANKGRIEFLGKQPSFRSIASTTTAFFILSIENPALLYKYDLYTDQVSLVYTEDHPNVFYDSMTFWNDQEGIAMGDPIGGCISLIITHDGGASWVKVPCERLPQVKDGEAAFASSDTNVVVKGNDTWLVSGGGASRVYHSIDKGRSWTVTTTPLLQGKETQGAYTMDFYDENRGIIYGGDYTVPAENTANIAVTEDGGATWKLIASGANDGYKSCVQYVPGSNGSEIVAAGFTGISYSADAGATWSKLSDAPLLTFRFANDSVAYGGGRNALTKITFKR